MTSSRRGAGRPAARASIERNSGSIEGPRTARAAQERSPRELVRHHFGPPARARMKSASSTLTRSDLIVPSFAARMGPSSQVSYVQIRDPMALLTICWTAHPSKTPVEIERGRQPLRARHRPRRQGRTRGRQGGGHAGNGDRGLCRKERGDRIDRSSGLVQRPIVADGTEVLQHPRVGIDLIVAAPARLEREAGVRFHDFAVAGRECLGPVRRSAVEDIQGALVERSMGGPSESWQTTLS